jgi:C4-dicarboxylate-specific signal transduction histidine kinase
VYVNYTDQWGTFRSVALPQQSPGGRGYLASADLEISDIRAMVRKNLVRSILVALFFLAASLPLILLVIHLFQAHTRTRRRLNAELQRQQDHLEELVQRRTADLEKETRRLQEALDKVRALRGLLPSARPAGRSATTTAIGTSSRTMS